MGSKRSFKSDVRSKREESSGTKVSSTTSISFNPKVFYYPSDKTTLWFGLNGTYDDRVGGDVTKIESGQDGIHQYTEENNVGWKIIDGSENTLTNLLRIIILGTDDGNPPNHVSIKIVKREFWIYGLLEKENMNSL